MKERYNRFDNLVMPDIHPIALDALVEFFARVAPPAGIDIGLGQRDLLDSDVLFSCHGCKHPIEQRLRIAKPARAAGQTRGSL